MSINKKVTFIRHGECISNVENIFQSIEDPLTEVGIEQAMSRGSILRDVQFDQTYTSTAVRTLQTLVYASSQGLEISTNYHSEPLMLEIDRGVYAGTTETPEKRAEIDAITNILTDRPEGGESVMDVRNRVDEFRTTYLNANFNHILLVGHSGWLKYLIAQLEGKSPKDALSMKSIGHTELCEITLDQLGNLITVISKLY